MWHIARKRYLKVLIPIQTIWSRYRVDYDPLLHNWQSFRGDLERVNSEKIWFFHIKKLKEFYFTTFTILVKKNTQFTRSSLSFKKYVYLQIILLIEILPRSIHSLKNLTFSVSFIKLTESEKWKNMIITWMCVLRYFSPWLKIKNFFIASFYDFLWFFYQTRSPTDILYFSRNQLSEDCERYSPLPIRRIHFSLKNASLSPNSKSDLDDAK